MGMSWSMPLPFANHPIIEGFFSVSAFPILAVTRSDMVAPCKKGGTRPQGQKHRIHPGLQVFLNHAFRTRRRQAGRQAGKKESAHDKGRAKKTGIQGDGHHHDSLGWGKRDEGKRERRKKKTKQEVSANFGLDWRRTRLLGYPWAFS